MQTASSIMAETIFCGTPAAAHAPSPKSPQGVAVLAHAFCQLMDLATIPAFDQRLRHALEEAGEEFAVTLTFELAQGLLAEANSQLTAIDLYWVHVALARSLELGVLSANRQSNIERLFEQALRAWQQDGAPNAPASERRKHPRHLNFGPTLNERRISRG